MIEVLEASWLTPTYFALLGIIFGSFFNVCIARIPGRMSLLPKSRCPHCLAPVPWYLNFPVFGWIALKGKCNNCEHPISIQYPLVEIAGGALFLGSYYYFGLTVDFASFSIFLSLLLVISVIDLHHKIIPDELSLTGIVLGLLYNYIFGRIIWWESALGALLGGGVFISLAMLYKSFTGREGLGGGDVKLLAMIGAWLGFSSLLPTIVVSSTLGTVVGIGAMVIQKKDMKFAIPFGPFLAFGAVIDLFFKEELEKLLYSII